jgi:hypothetical protein
VSNSETFCDGSDTRDPKPRASLEDVQRAGTPVFDVLDVDTGTLLLALVLVVSRDV